MKSKDIKPGQIYACGSESVRPVVFLAAPTAAALYTRNRYPQNGQPVFRRAIGVTRPRIARSWTDADVGWAAVALTRSHEGDPAALLTVTLEDFTAATKEDDAERGITYTLITNPAHITGLYAEVTAKQQQEQEAARALQARQAAAYQERRNRADRLAAALATHGVTTQAADHELRISFDDAEKLIALLKATGI